jgi:hypothetical protein
MIPKSCRLFGQDHATKQVIRAKWRFDLIPFRSSGDRASLLNRDFRPASSFKARGISLTARALSSNGNVRALARRRHKNRRTRHDVDRSGSGGALQPFRPTEKPMLFRLKTSA